MVFHIFTLVYYVGLAPTLPLSLTDTGTLTHVGTLGRQWTLKSSGKKYDAGKEIVVIWGNNQPWLRDPDNHNILDGKMPCPRSRVSRSPWSVRYTYILLTKRENLSGALQTSVSARRH